MASWVKYHAYSFTFPKDLLFVYRNGYKDVQGTQWQLQGTEWELQHYEKEIETINKNQEGIKNTISEVKKKKKKTH